MIHGLTYLLYLIYRKDNEINSLNGKLESEQNLVIQLQKKIKELQVHAKTVHLKKFISKTM